VDETAIVAINGVGGGVLLVVGRWRHLLGAMDVARPTSASA
jgi:hypothetical protein